MATVLAFEPRQVVHANRQIPAEPGTVLLFTGIRYERARPNEAEDAVRRGNSARPARPQRPV